MVALPPRPDAVVTTLSSDQQLPGVQTMLYSLKKTAPKDVMNCKSQERYPPELVVLCASSVATTVRQALCPAFCTRIIDVPETEKYSKDMFRRYGQVLFLRPDCLIQEDVVSPALFGYDESGGKSDGPGLIFRPNKMNDDQLTETITDFKKSNGVRLLPDTLVVEDSRSYDKSPRSGIAILDFSDAEKKPWEYGSGDDDDDDEPKSVTMWKVWYQKSRTFATRTAKETKEREEQERHQKEKIEKKKLFKAQQQKQNSPPSSSSASTNQQAAEKSNHKAITKRFRELRKQGMSTQEAMEQARNELGPKSQPSASQQVAAMFGMR